MATASRLNAATKSSRIERSSSITRIRGVSIASARCKNLAVSDVLLRLRPPSRETRDGAPVRNAPFERKRELIEQRLRFPFVRPFEQHEKLTASEQADDVGLPQPPP